MSVFGTFRIDVRPYSAYADPSLPIATWIAQGSLVGDVSGGTLSIEFRILTDVEPRTTELYNLEQLTVDSSSDTNREFILRTLNLDQLSAQRVVFDRRWSFRTEGVLATAFNAIPMDKTNILPIWLGAPNDDEGDSAIRIVTSNVNGAQYLATLQGYIWGPRSILAAGGPQRPISGLFGG